MVASWGWRHWRQPCWLRNKHVLYHQVQSCTHLYQAPARPWQGIRHTGILPLPQEGDSHQAGQHDHGAQAVARGLEEAEGM